VTFVDTSALLGSLNRSDERHDEAVKILRQLSAAREPLLTTDIVVVETCTLAQRRLGQEAAEALVRDILSLLVVCHIDDAILESGVSAWLRGSRRKLSLTDCISFAFMRANGIERAFAFDRDYVAAGFKLV
jgi:uncharacterized protein